MHCKRSHWSRAGGLGKHKLTQFVPASTSNRPKSSGVRTAATFGADENAVYEEHSVLYHGPFDPLRNMRMSMSSVFEQVGAPLNNHMWSWGAVREQDKTVFLRVWEDEGRKMDDLPEKYFIGVWTTDSTDTSLGANERRSHIELIKAGYKVYLLMCERDATASKSSVLAFDARELREGGRLVERDGVLWIALLARVPVRLLRPASTA